ncbi:MAG: cupin domain-containing protein [Micrococcales bacterium]|nr:cupin domain-containing protein [Micrococcales bacterium]
MSYPAQIYSGESGEATAWRVPADSAPDVVYRRTGNRVRYLARGTDTTGTYGLCHWHFAGPPTGPGPHFHRTMTESFYVLSGIVTIYDGRDWVRCWPGDFVHVPAGGMHGFRNEDGPAEMLLHFAPGAPREAYFERLARGIEDMTPGERDDFMRAHDNVEPPD